LISLTEEVGEPHIVRALPLLLSIEVLQSVSQVGFDRDHSYKKIKRSI
jgi:Zn-finger domain-containing protein